MRRPWSQDPKIIMETLVNFIATGLPATIHVAKSPAMRTRLLGIESHGERLYLLAVRPRGLENSQSIQSLLFKMRGTPVLGFSCLVERESDSLFAVPLPVQIFQLELRKNARISTLSGSMATFFIKNRARVSICTLEDISMGGVKLVGRPTHHIRENDIIGPCTLSLAGRDALITREVTFNSARVVRIADEDGHSGQFGLGIRFELTDSERGQLKEHIGFIGGV